MPHSHLRRLLALGLLAPWLLTGCGSEEEETPTDPDTLPQFARDMLDAHNTVRAGGARPAPNPPLEPLGWDADAEETAKNWAARCRFEHNQDRDGYGENLAAATPGHWQNAREVVLAWAAEVEDYDYENNTCAEGKQCGHYTQVVWRATKRVGCAMQVCDRNSPFGSQFPTWHLWVCNYAPPGNYIGQRPY